MLIISKIPKKKFFYLNHSRNYVRVIFKDNKDKFTCKGKIGDTIHQIAKKNYDKNSKLLDDKIQFACGGEMACATCHLIIDPKWFSIVGQPSEEEMDLLDMVNNYKDTSRLGCQIKLKKELDGLEVEIPED